jgi:hypothetical protein
MSVSWDMSIGESLKRRDTHPNKQEIEAIKKHLKTLGFKFKSTKDDHCFVEMVSRFKIDKNLEFVSQNGTLYYNPKRPLRDLLHELDHIYQLKTAAQLNKKSYLQANIINIRLVKEQKSVKVPPIIVHFLLNQVINNDSFKLEGDVQVLIQKNKPKNVFLSIGKKELFISPDRLLTHTRCKSIIDFVSTWNQLKEAEQRELLESFISPYDNEEMEIAAYNRELKRANKYSDLALTEKQQEEMESLAFENYTRFHGKGKKPTVLNYTWEKNAELKSIPHYYLESRVNINQSKEQPTFGSNDSIVFFPSKPASKESLNSSKSSMMVCSVL